MLNTKRLKTNPAEQGELLPTYLSDLVEEDHPARIMSVLVDTLDLSILYNKYSWEGGETYHPKSMLKILFYGYSHETRSSRKLSQACRENFVYMYIASGIRPDFRTINLFRKNNLDILKELFKQVVKLCYQLEMISFGTISLDGTKIKANASRHRIVKKDKLEKMMTRLDEEIEQMLEEAEDLDAQEDEEYGESNDGTEVPDNLKTAKGRKETISKLKKELEEKNVKKMSLTDKDSRLMKSNGRIDLSYNGQCATENQVILAYNINNQEVDADQLVPMVDELESIAYPLNGKEEYPLEGSKLLTDSGYDSGKNLTYLQSRKIDGYVANQMHSVYEKEKKGRIPPRPFTKDKFSYQEKDDIYICPTGEKLYPVERRTSKVKTYVRHEVRYKCRSCHNCGHQHECVKSKSGYRQIKRILEYDSYRKSIDKKLQTETGKNIFKRRKTDIEPTFGQIKTITFGQKGFLLRGSEKVKGEFGLACIVHNIRKIISYLNSDENDMNISNIYELSMQMVS
ncbi:IS1182 family transposase [bacterium]